MKRFKVLKETSLFSRMTEISFFGNRKVKKIKTCKISYTFLTKWMEFITVCEKENEQKSEAEKEEEQEKIFYALHKFISDFCKLMLS